MPPSLEHVFTIHGMIQKEHVLQLQTVKGGPQRVVAPIGKGFIKGKDFEAEIVPGGADWMLIDPTTSTARLDVRLSAHTPTSHSLSIHYTGIIKIDEKCAGPMVFDPKPECTRFGDHEWFANPVVETSDPELKWMEGCVWVGEGRWVVEGGEVGIEYEVFRVEGRGGEGRLV